MPSIRPKELLRFLKKQGYFIHHQVGSHLILKHPDDSTKRITLPMHNKDLKAGTLASILKQTGIKKKELFK